MSTELDDKVDLWPTDAGDHDTFSHYVKKDMLEKAIFEGKSVIALCGKVWLPTKDPMRFPVCPDCKKAWESLNEGPSK